MKRTTLIAAWLTLFSLLLIVAATAFFLWQGRSQSVADRERLGQEAAQLNDALQERDVLLIAREQALVTVEAQATRLTVTIAAQQEAGRASAAADSVAQQTVEAMQATINTQQAALATQQAALASQQQAERQQPPQVLLVAPLENSIFSEGEVVTIQVSASDRFGMAAVNVTANGETVLSYSAADEPLVTVSRGWQPENAGIYTLSATAININGFASTPLTRTITIVSQKAIDTLSELRGEIETRVSSLRQLDPLRPITFTFLSTTALMQRVEEDFLADYSLEEANDDVKILSAFDFLPINFDMYTFYNDFLSSQVLGFYDSEDDTFYIVSEDDTLDEAEQATYAHEFMHALQDQHFDLDAQMEQDLNDDARLALGAMVEGEASFIEEFEFFKDLSFTPELRLETYDTCTDPRSPEMLCDNLAFPYLNGALFVSELYKAGGFAALDAAWGDLPRSTEQVLHPERYFDGDIPQLVTLPPLTDTLGSGWQQLDENVFGEFILREYLAQRVNEGDVDRAATGWGGDRYAVYWQSSLNQPLMVLSLLWDRAEDGAEFAAIYPEYAGRLTGDSGKLSNNNGMCWTASDVICLYDLGQASLIVRGPELALVEQIAGIIQAYQTN